MIETMETEICIVGAGPAGATASLLLAKHKIPHILIDKATFPREKVCGDALTLEAMHTLNQIDEKYVESFKSHSDFLPSWGLSASSPSGKELSMTLPKDLPFAPFYVVRRSAFDNFLVENLDANYVTSFFGAEVMGVIQKDGKAEVLFEQNGVERKVIANIIFGADGATSAVHKFLSGEKRKDLEHNSASVRAYYSGVTGFGDKNEIEFHFIKDLLPGYFWIFPMPNGEANVGVIVKSKDANKLRKKFHEIIETHPKFAPRFKNAKIQGKLQGWTLPLNSVKRNLAGANFMLLGDAGSLIESFSGKGIGIAMISARVAVEFALKAIEKQDFSADQLSEYNTAMYKRYNTEWLMSYKFQQWYESSTFVNFLTHLYNFPGMRQLTETLLEKWTRKWM
ncbi:MAG: geranylgeranyl reductase family protein [Arenicella sp.]|jgi:geranylgeranyl reductase family protein